MVGVTKQLYKHTNIILIVISISLLAACVGELAATEPQPESERVSLPPPEEPLAALPEPEPATLLPENWPGHFAALVEEIDLPEDGSSIFGFHLTDIDLDGWPELLVEVGLPMGAGPYLRVLRWDFPFEEIGGAFSWNELTFSGLPLRFFRSEDTGEVIYSSLVFNHGVRMILYAFVEDPGLAFRMVMCQTQNNHFLYEMAEDGWEVVEEFIATPDADGIGDLCDCGIEYGRNSPDPTIVQLVNRALEGFTEIPAPPVYSFEPQETDDGYFVFTPDHIGAIQAWIFEVAESYGS